MNEKLLKIIEEYQNLPNAPFLQKHTSDYIRNKLRSSNLKFEENEYFFIVKPENFNPEKNKLLIMAHMDHPSVVLKNNKEGKILGLIGTQKMVEYIKNHTVLLNVISPEGKHLGKAKLENIIPGPKQTVEINADFKIPANSIARWDIDTFKKTESTLELYNADNGIMVCIALHMLEENLFGNIFNTYVAFIKHEEVHQVSSWKLAKDNKIGLTEKDYILNLECLKTESIDEKKYGKVTYEDGPVLQLSNTGCLFGYKNPGPNLLELTLRKIAKENNLKLQNGIVKDSCDSRPFTQFAISPNIATLTIPNKYKHNGADDGDIRPEEILIEDVKTSIELLKKLTTENTDTTNLESISEKLKKNREVTDENLMAHKRLLNIRLGIAYKKVVKREYFYPKNVFDYISDFILKIISYIAYYVS